jgi:hypothetical protein
MNVTSFSAVWVRIILLLSVLLCSLKGNAQSYNFESVGVSGTAPLPAHSADGLPPALRQIRFVGLQPQPAVLSETRVHMQRDDSRNFSAPAFQVDRKGCDLKNPHSRACRLKYFSAFAQSFELLSIDMAGVMAMDPIGRANFVQAITHGQFWSNYWKTLQNFRYMHWNDDDSIQTTWIGHPMEGAGLEFIWIQNNPKVNSLQFENTRRYWNSRLWAMLPSTLFSAEWLLGPLSESAIGNQGIGYYHYKAHHNKLTNGTGCVDFYITPIGGLLWSVGEDWLDLHVVKKFKAKHRNWALRLLVSTITPTKSEANLLRFKAPWYRDYEHLPAGLPAD